jgi:hypothetical protein
MMGYICNSSCKGDIGRRIESQGWPREKNARPYLKINLKQKGLAVWLK